jgi:hypothetical protein
MILTSYLCVGVHYRRKNNGLSSEAAPISIVTLWIYMVTAAGSSGLLWNTVQVGQPDLVVPNGRVGFKQLVFGIFVDVT